MKYFKPFIIGFAFTFVCITIGKKIARIDLYDKDDLNMAVYKAVQETKLKDYKLLQDLYDSTVNEGYKVDYDMHSDTFMYLMGKRDILFKAKNLIKKWK